MLLKINFQGYCFLSGLHERGGVIFSNRVGWWRTVCGGEEGKLWNCIGNKSRLIWCILPINLLLFGIRILLNHRLSFATILVLACRILPIGQDRRCKRFVPHRLQALPICTLRLVARCDPA